MTLLKTAGSKAILEQRLTGLIGVNRAVIYGSWARRHYGETGPMPQDIDLFIVGTGDVGGLRAGADTAARTLGRDVNVSVLSPEQWDAAERGFITHVEAGPLVELDLSQ